MSRTAEEPADLRTLPGRLRWARENAGYRSIRAAATANRWNENTYKAHEQGERGSQGLKAKTAEKYAKAFDVSVQWLQHGTGPRKPVYTDDVTQAEIEAAVRLIRSMKSAS